MGQKFLKGRGEDYRDFKSLPRVFPDRGECPKRHIHANIYTGETQNITYDIM